MHRVPFNERITCTVPDALAATGLGRTKFYELIGRKIVETTKVDGRTLVIVDSLKRIAHGAADPTAEPADVAA